MKIVLTELIVHQMKTVGVMFCAGVILESLWMIRSLLMKKTEKFNRLAKWSRKLMIEGLFWSAAAFVIPMFLYYCSYGKVTWYGTIGFLIGLLLWKKISYGIINQVWVEKEEAESLETTARSSISNRPENKGWKKDGRKRKRKKKK